jgi:hypothetical protein
MKRKESCPHCSSEIVTQRDGNTIFYAFAMMFMVECLAIFWYLDSVIFRAGTVLFMAACISYFESFRRCATCDHQWRRKYFGVFGAASTFKADWKSFVLLQITVILLGVAMGMVATLLV